MIGSAPNAKLLNTDTFRELHHAQENANIRVLKLNEKKKKLGPSRRCRSSVHFLKITRDSFSVFENKTN